jgi:hypothetical protein
VLIGAVAASALLAATPATAGKQHWLGNIDTGGNVKFVVKAKNGHRVVTGFLFNNAKAQCNEGTEFFTNEGLPIGPMAVSNNTFDGNQPVDPNGLIKVHGQITHHHRKAYGTIKLSGDINQFHNCFGKNPWHAARK